MSRPPRRPHHSNDERRDGGLLLLVLALFLFVGALFIEGERGAQNKSSLSSRQPSRVSSETIRRINDALQESQIKMEIEEGSVNYENVAAEPPDENADEDYSGVHPLIFDQENPGARVLKDTERRQTRRGPPSPDQRISKKLERDEWARDFESRRDAEYVRQFIENARRQGVEIRLNENLEVVSVRRLEVEKPMRLPQSVPALPEEGDGSSPK